MASKGNGVRTEDLAMRAIGSTSQRDHVRCPPIGTLTGIPLLVSVSFLDIRMWVDVVA